MAVNFKLKNTTVTAVFGYLEIPHEKLEKFQLFGLKLDMATDGLVISAPQSGSNTKITSTPVAISSLKNGKLGSVTSAYLKKAFLQVLDSLPAHPSEWSGEFVQPNGETVVSKEEAKTVKDIISEAGPTVGGIEVFPMDKLHSAARVLLRDATQMYQPVHGTGGDSRYFVIALSDSFKVAARWQGQTMSIRVEGKGVGAMGHALTSIGFNNVKAEYASVHLQVGTDVLLANRTLGAMIASMSEYTALKTPVPSAKVVRVK